MINWSGLENYIYKSYMTVSVALFHFFYEIFYYFLVFLYKIVWCLLQTITNDYLFTNDVVNRGIKSNVKKEKILEVYIIDMA